MTAADALQPAILFLGAGLAAALVSRAVRASPVAGYLIAGLVIGPSGFGLLQNNETTRFLAELGVVFLLFDIGLHFSLREIRTRSDDMITLAPLQLVLCGGAFAMLGIAFGFPAPVAALVGLSLALSSTAVVARILADRNLPDCPMGRSATAVLVAQDVIAIFLLTFAVSISEDPTQLGAEALFIIAKGGLALALALIAARYIVRPLFETLAQTNNREIFTVLALFIVLAASAATARLGLSLTLGAFLAGMALSDTPYRHVVQSEIKPFAGLFLGLFFMSVGMGVNLPALAAVWPAVLAVSLTLLLTKTSVIFVSARLNGWGVPGATQLGFLLSQGSEFTLVILGVSAIALALPGDWAGLITAAVAVTLVIAPAWTSLGLHVARLAAERDRSSQPALPETTRDRPVVIFGMTEHGRLAADALRDHDITYLGIDQDPERFVSAVSDGYETLFGDIRDPDLMTRIAITDARAVVLGAHEPDADSLPSLRDAPAETCFVLALSTAEAERLAARGFRVHAPQSDPGDARRLSDLLLSLGVSEERLAVWIRDKADRRGAPPGPSQSLAGAA